MATEEREIPKKESNPVAVGGEEEETADHHHSIFIKRRCCCCIPIFSSNRSRTLGFKTWDSVRTSEVDEDRWWDRGVRAMMKFREWSEIIAGPRWKTFIRRFNRTRSFGGGSGGGGGGGGRHFGKFQYDPLSYSLNFDEGHGPNGHLDEDGGDDYGGHRDFSSRYASVSIPVRAA